MSASAWPEEPVLWLWNNVDHCERWVRVHSWLLRLSELGIPPEQRSKVRSALELVRAEVRKADARALERLLELPEAMP